MDLSKLKIEIYDFLGLIVPGLVFIFEVWATYEGWNGFVKSVASVSGTTLTILLLVSFCVGHLIQESADATLKWWKGPRYFRKSRDAFWTTEEGKAIRQVIADELGREAPPIDGCFDYCLTKIKDRFPKRDLFIATSDLSRAMLVLLIAALAPLARFILDGVRDSRLASGLIVLSAAALLLICRVAWIRMVRFRDLSEITVFRAYLAMVTESKIRTAEKD